jgi:lipooligosaccharide transport system ATP-binding protein
MGENGAGKSTLLRLIAGLQTPQRGTVSFPGNQGRDVRAFVGYCPQESLVFADLTVREQLVLAVRAHGQARGPAQTRATELALRLGLDAHAHKLAVALSGGMLRRLNIALSLASAPGLWLLDEPSAGLDTEQRALLHGCIRAERERGTCVVFCSHDDAEVRALADSVCIMHKGRAVAQGAPEALLSRLRFPACVEITFAKPPAHPQELQAHVTAAMGQKPMVWAGATLHVDVEDTVAALGQVSAALASVSPAPLAIAGRQKTLTDAARALAHEAGAP